MMEEVDFEDEILIIHPDEDIRKIEELETDNILNLELSIHPDEDIRKIEGPETDTNSNLELSIHPDEDIRKIEGPETDTNSNLELSILSNEDARKVEVIDINSDSGEIDDDEEANDLEEGEIEDNTLVSKKRTDIACRFFKRGGCVFGSQCQFLHVSDTVYKMFDTNPQKKTDMPLVDHHNFPKPPIFPPIILPPRPFIEPPISVVSKADFHRPCDTVEDTWEKGLEQARILIRKKANLRKIENSEPKKFDSKDEKNRGQNFAKADGVENELDFNKKKYSEKNSTNCSFRKENTYNEKKSNYRHQPKSSDKWVDPWRRSKSPLSKKRPRSLSGSPPSRSRKHSSTSSTSSMSSSSSEINNIYRKPYEKKSPRGQRRFKSRSQSVSPSRRPKKRMISPKRPFNGRRNLRSNSRSLSRSPYRKRTFSSRTESRSSSSSSSCSGCQKSPIFEDKNMKRISDRLSEQISRKSPNRTTELLDSDCETSEMTVSSASCTPLSSDSETEGHRLSPFLRSRQSPNRNNASSYSNKSTYLANPKVFNRNHSLKNQNLMHQKDDLVSSYQKKMQPSNNHKNTNNWNFKTEQSDYKPKNSASYFRSVQKPASAPKFSENKMSNDTDRKSKNLPASFTSVAKPASASKPTTASKVATSVPKPAPSSKATGNKLSKDMELLFMYQGLGDFNKKSNNVQKAISSNTTSKLNRTEDAVSATNKANGNSETHSNISKVDNASKKNIVLNLQPKCKDFFKPEIFNKPQDLNDEMVTVKKETASKREQLLNKLRLIDDAIARKKGK